MNKKECVTLNKEEEEFLEFSLRLQEEVVQLFTTRGASKKGIGIMSYITRN